jgi:hypothetical protein
MLQSDDVTQLAAWLYALDAFTENQALGEARDLPAAHFVDLLAGRKIILNGRMR